MSDAANIRNLRILSLLTVAALGYSVRSAIGEGGPIVMILAAAVLSIGLLFVTWQPGGRALRWLREAVVRTWGVWLAALVLIGPVTALGSNWILRRYVSLRGIPTWALDVGLDLEPLRQWLFPLIGLLLGAVVGPDGFRAIADQCQGFLRQTGMGLDRVFAAIRTPAARSRLGVIIGLGSLCGWLVWSFFRAEVYSYLPINDAGFYLYIGWHTLRGGIPYRTVYYNHPPLQFVVSMGWALAAQITGANVVNVAQTYDLLVGLGLVVLVYGVTRDFTKSKLAGWVAALTLVGMEAQLLALITSYSPGTKMSIAFLNVLGVWLIMRRRWLAAGLVVAMATSMWLPSGSLLVVLAIVVWLQRTDNRLKALGRAAVAATLVLAAQVVALALAGSLGHAFRQVVGTAFNTVTHNSSEASAAAGGLVGRIATYGIFMQINWITDDLLLIGLIVCGAAIWLLNLKRENPLHMPDRITVPLASILMLGLIFADFQGVPDAFMICTLVCPFAGLAFARFTAKLGQVMPEDMAALRRATISLCLAWLLLISLSDITPKLVKLRGTDLTVIEKQGATLAAMLKPEDKVQTLTANWFNILVGIDNPTPYISNGRKALRDYITVEGKSVDDMAADLSAQDPVIVVMDAVNMRAVRESALGAWLSSRYVNKATIYNGITRSLVFVRLDRPEIQQVVEDLWGKPAAAP